MAASTAGMIVLRNRKNGMTRSETFTMTPTDGQYVTFSNSGQTHLLTAPEGEDIVDIQFNNDGVTTVTQAQLKVNGQDINNRYLMVLFAADSTMPTRVVSPVAIGGGKQLQMQLHA
jgi:hypothetical protein